MNSPTSDETQLRLTELEAKLASQEENNKQMLTTLNTTLQLVAAMTANQNTLLHTQPPLPTASANPPKLDLKPSPPPNFDGDRQKGKGFINACQACLHPDQFMDEQTKMGNDLHESRKSSLIVFTTGKQLSQTLEVLTLSIGMTVGIYSVIGKLDRSQ